MGPGSESNPKHEPESIPRPMPETERNNFQPLDPISVSRFLQLVESAFENSKLFAIIERLRLNPPAHEDRALEQIQLILNVVSGRIDGPEIMRELLYKGELPQFKFLSARAKALEYLLRPESVDSRAVHAALVELNTTDENFSAKCVIANALNRLPINSLEVADEYLKFFVHRISQANGDQIGSEQVLALLSPKFEIEPSLRQSQSLCDRIADSVRRGVRLPSPIFELLGRVNTDLTRKTLEDVVSGEALKPPTFTDIATSHLGLRLFKSALTAVVIHLTGVISGATSLAGEVGNWLIVGAAAVAFQMLWRPYFEYQLERLKIRSEPHPINTIRAVMALGRQLPDPKIVDCLSRLLARANLKEYARQEVRRVMTGVPDSESSA